MYLCRVAVASSDPTAPQTSAAVFTDLIWAHCRPGDGLQHVRGRTVDGAIRITFFLSAKDQETADATARELCARLVETVPALAHYSVILSMPPNPFESS
jgi:hypothetical protein